jgi:DNA methyltransferase 1-associated protein 1
VIEQPAYKARPKWTHPVRPWEQTAFTNPARDDGLVLRHWRKKKTTPAAASNAPNTPADSRTEHETDTKSIQTESDYHFAKFNIKVSGPKYNDSQYESLLKSNEWSKEETDYLINLALDYDLRWIVITDRYDYRPQQTKSDGDAMAITISPKARTMEDLKARYYDVAAKMMAFHNPLSSMSAVEFDLHEKMTKFDPKRETMRKNLAEALMSRSQEEIKEEEILLGELKRIVLNEERFSQERKELYARLEEPRSTLSVTQYESSAGLAQLMQTLLSVDKNKKQRRALTGPGDGQSSPAPGTAGSNPAGQGSRDQRNSIGSSGIKRGSISGPSHQRQLSRSEELKYGVTHHDRLTSGVQLRQYRIEKLMQAKSQAQSKKLDEALRELQVPHKAVMPTTKVCTEYERLVASISTLLEIRKVSEKVENEIKVLRQQQEHRERKENGETSATPHASSPQAEGDEEGDQTMKMSGDEDDDADGEADNAEAEVDEEAKQSGDDGEGEDEEENEDEEDGEGDAEVDDDDEEGKSDDDDGGQDGEEEDDGGGELEEEDAADEPSVMEAPTTRGSMHKRSASMLSVSGGSEKSTKRQRK